MKITEAQALMQLAQGLNQLAKTIYAPKAMQFELDEQGMPVGATCCPMMDPEGSDA